MIKELASQTTSITYAVGVLVIFIAFFAGTLLWVYRKSGKADYDKLSKLPLDPNHQEDVIKAHTFDGIEEYDNRLPSWWVGTFVVTVLFSLGYWFYYHVTSTGPDSIKRYEIAKQEMSTQNSEAKKTEGSVSDEALIAISKNPSALESAKTSFLQNCSACHGVNAQGIIGPNLTDDFWIHGGKPTQILTTIENGVAAKGMLAWKGVIKPDQIHELVGYILSLNGSNPSGAKPPEGNPIE